MASTANITLLDEDGVARTYNDVSRIALKNADDPSETVVFSLDGAGSALLKSIIDGSVTEIAADDLYGITEIRNYAFDSCANLTSIAIPNTVTTIGGWAFSGCSKLESVSMGTGVTSIGQSAFGTSGLRRVYINDLAAWCGIYFYNNYSNPLVRYNSSEVNDIILNGSICYTLTIPNSVNTIKKYAFIRSSITSLFVPNSVWTIAEYGFNSCKNLETVTIGNGISGIGSYAFAGCSSLTTIVCQATSPPTIYSTTFNSVPATCAIYVPAAGVNAYKSASYWSSRAAYIQAIPT